MSRLTRCSLSVIGFSPFGRDGCLGRRPQSSERSHDNSVLEFILADLDGSEELGLLDHGHVLMRQIEIEESSLGFYTESRPILFEW